MNEEQGKKEILRFIKESKGKTYSDSEEIIAHNCCFICVVPPDNGEKLVRIFNGKHVEKSYSFYDLMVEIDNDYVLTCTISPETKTLLSRYEKGQKLGSISMTACIDQGKIKLFDGIIHDLEA